MKTTLALLGLALLTSCGGTITYTDPVTGVTYTEVIDGEINGSFTIPPEGIKIEGGTIVVEPAK